MNAIEGRLSDYAAAHTKEVEGILKIVEKETEERSKHAQMMVGRVEGTLLRFIVQISEARSILEIGTFTGYSALMMASALPQDGRLVTLEKSEKHAMVARDYFDRSGFGHKITSIVGDAKDTLCDLNGPFDIVFIDADKSSYDFYYEKGLSLLLPGGLIILDNMLWDGEVLDPKDEESLAIDRLNEKIAKDHRVENVLLTVRDGVMLVRKKMELSSDWRRTLEAKTRNMMRRERRKKISSRSNTAEAHNQKASKFAKGESAHSSRLADPSGARGRKASSRGRK